MWNLQAFLNIISLIKVWVFRNQGKIYFITGLISPFSRSIIRKRTGYVTHVFYSNNSNNRGCVSQTTTRLQHLAKHSGFSMLCHYLATEDISLSVHCPSIECTHGCCRTCNEAYLAFVSKCPSKSCPFHLPHR